MNLTVKFRVSGRVQGVFFRASTLREAETLGLTGWVRNCSNGDVEGMASGPEDRLVEFRAWLKEGPPMAAVENLDVEDCEFQPFKGFSVR